MKKGVNFCLWLTIFFGFFKAGAQDNSEFVQFFVNSASLNPSYVGIDGQTALYIGYRRQWANVPGGPALGMVSLQGHLPKKKIHGGVTLASNSRGLLSTSSFLFTGGYQLSVAEGKAVRFGMSIGGAMNRFDVGGIENANPADPALANLPANTLFIQGSAGASYHTKTFHGGISIPQFFTPAYVADNPFSVTKVSPFQTIVIHASNRFYYNRNKNVFEPYLIYRINQGLPGQLEIASVVHLQSKMWVGASFKQGLGISALGGIKLNKLSAFGYSFTTAIGKDRIARPSHELHLAFLFGKRDRNVTGIYSFVNTDVEKKKKTQAQIIAERKAREEAMAKKYQQHNVHTEKHEEVKPTPVQPKKDTVVVAEQKKDTVVVTQQPAQPPAVERHEFVKRGKNKNELPAGTYVIVGAFRSETNAKNYSVDLQDMDIEEADYGFISVRNLWYVYLHSSDDLGKARQERDKYRAEKMFKDAWLLTVQ